MSPTKAYVFVVAGHRKHRVGRWPMFTSNTSTKWWVTTLNAAARIIGTTNARSAAQETREATTQHRGVTGTMYAPTPRGRAQLDTTSRY
jgi:hypothetical protein